MGVPEVNQRNSRTPGARLLICSQAVKWAQRIFPNCSRLSVFIVTALAFSVQAHGKAPSTVFVTLPENVNSCAKVTISTIATVTTKCADITILYCLFGETGPMWTCRSDKINASKPAAKFPLSRQSIRQVYVGACKPNVIECVRRQNWLLAAVDGRQNPYLAVQLMEPGSEGEPLDPSIIERRRRPRG